MTSSNAAAADPGRAATASPTATAPLAATFDSTDSTMRSQSDGPAIIPASNDSANSNPNAIAASQPLELSDKTDTDRLRPNPEPLLDPIPAALIQAPESEPTKLKSEPTSPHNDNADDDDDVAMPSPPTVSPLSTPAATHMHTDENMGDEELTTLTANAPSVPALRDPSLFRNPAFNSASMAPINMATATADMMQLDDPFEPTLPDYLHQQQQIQAIATTDPEPNAVDFNAGVLSGMQPSQGSIDPNAYVMNLAAQATLFAESGPVVVDPTAVSLHSFTQDDDARTASVRPTSASGSQRLESYAQIEFADSTFQMTTYAVIIGRDQQAMEQARIDERREANYRRKCQENASKGLPPPTPLQPEKNKYSKSYVSEEGGMLGPECSDGEDVPRPVKKRRPSSAAQSSGGEENASGDHGQSNRQYVSHSPGAAAVDIGVQQPTSEHIPFIAIHSPGPDIASKTRGISRQHLKIQFNKERGVFEAIALHKNGFFCHDILYGVDSPATLKSGSLLQIKDVEFRFIINGVQWGMTGAEDEEASSSKRMSIGGKEMSLDFEHSDHENFNDTSDEEEEEVSGAENNIATPLPESEVGEEVPEPAIPQPLGEEEQNLLGLESYIPEASIPTDGIPPEFAMPEIPRRRGPGRPPKDGIMSKRERRLLKKQMQETSKKTLPQNPESEKIKRPVGRPRKNPLEEGEQGEKRKYIKRGPDGEPLPDEAEKRVKEKKDKKVRPKSPPLELRREDYTEEQLQKPSKNYGVLIDEALTNGPPDGLTLKQIYKRIQARYPWFYFMAETKGWESSVRHNLIGNEAFLKDEETSLWSRVPGIELDAGKKRKANSPDRHLGPSHLPAHITHPYYNQNNPYTTSNTNTYAHGALQAYSTESKQPQAAFHPNVQNTQPQAAPLQPVTQTAFAAQTPAPAQLPPGYGSSVLSKPATTAQQSTYSSPYARPPPAAKPAVKSETNTLAPPAIATTSNTQPAVSTQPNQSKPPPAAQQGQGQQFSQTVEDAIKIFCSKMLTTLGQSSPYATQIVENAVCNFRGLPVPHHIPTADDTVKTLVVALQNMVKDMQRRGTQITPTQNPTHSVTPVPATGNVPATTPTTARASTPANPRLEAEIRRRVKNFRESMVKALTTKTDQAEIIVDSAINRAQGLPHGDKISGWEKADELMVKSVTQIMTEVRNEFAAKTQSASPAPPAPSRQAPMSQSVQAAQPTQFTQPTGLAHTNLQQAGPSTSPAAAQPPLSRTATPSVPNTGASVSQQPAAQASTSSNVNMTPSPLARPPVSFQRPAPAPTPRLSGSPMPRPAPPRKDPITTQTPPSNHVPPAPRPNVSTPAQPSAGVLDQITGQRRFGSSNTNQSSVHGSHGNANHVNIAGPANTFGAGKLSNNTANSGAKTTSMAPGPLTCTTASNTPNKPSSSSGANTAPNTVNQPANRAPVSSGSMTATATESNASTNGTDSVVRQTTTNSTVTAQSTPPVVTSSDTTTSTSPATATNVTGRPTTMPFASLPSIQSSENANTAAATNTGTPVNAAATTAANGASTGKQASLGNTSSTVVGAAATPGSTLSTNSTMSNTAVPRKMMSGTPTTTNAVTAPAAVTSMTSSHTINNTSDTVAGSRFGNGSSNPLPTTIASSNGPDTIASSDAPHPDAVATSSAPIASPAASNIDQTTSHPATIVTTGDTNIGRPASPDPRPSVPKVVTNTATATTALASIGQADTLPKEQPPSVTAIGDRRPDIQSSSSGVVNAPGGVVASGEQYRSKTTTPVGNAPPAPSGIVGADQIAGQKRSLEEGPGSSSVEQPEAKRLEVSPN